MLLLKANVVPELNVNVILKQPEDYVDSKKYVSWERYFTDLLVDNTRNSPIWAYSKRKLQKNIFVIKGGKCCEKNYEIN